MSELTNLNPDPAIVFQQRPWMCLKGLIITLHICFLMVVCAQENTQTGNSIKELYQTVKERKKAGSWR